jgi:hypothetical protein
MGSKRVARCGVAHVWHTGAASIEIPDAMALGVLLWIRGIDGRRLYAWLAWAPLRLLVARPDAVAYGNLP